MINDIWLPFVPVIADVPIVQEAISWILWWYFFYIIISFMLHVITTVMTKEI